MSPAEVCDGSADWEGLKQYLSAGEFILYLFSISIAPGVGSFQEPGDTSSLNKYSRCLAIAWYSFSCRNLYLATLSVFNLKQIWVEFLNQGSVFETKVKSLLWF